VFSVAILGGLACAATFSVSISQILLGLALAATSVRVVRRRDPAALATGLEGPLLALLIWAVAMVPLSGDRLQSLVFLRRFYLFGALVVAAGLARHPTWGSLASRVVLAALMIGGAGVAIYGLVQYVRLGGAFVDSWDGFLKDRVVLTQGYMTAGGLLMLLALVATAFLLTVRSRLVAGLLAAAALPVGAALVLTLTRSAWLGFAAGALVMILAARPRLAPLVLVATLAAAVAAPGLVGDRVRSSFDPDHYQNSQRVQMWQTGLRIIADHPVTGVGDHDLDETFWAYREREAGGPVSREAYPGGPILVVGHLHNNLLQLAAIWGLPGLAFALILFGAMAWRLVRSWRRGRSLDVDPGDPVPPQGWVLAALGCWCGFMTAGMFEWYFGDAEVALLTWLIVGMGLGSGARAEAGGRAHSE
jgi:O-antigen ligase